MDAPEAKDTVKPILAETPAPVAPTAGPLDDFDLSSFTDQSATNLADIVKEVSAPETAPTVAQEILDLAKDAGLTDEQIKGLAQADVVKKVRETVKKPDAKAEVKPAEAKVAEPTAPAVSHPPTLIQAARALGIQDHHIQGVQTDALVDWVLRLQQSSKPTETKAPIVDEQEARIAQLEKDGLYDPAVYAVMRHENAKNKAMEAELAKTKEEFQKFTAHQRDRDMNASLDEAFSNLPPEFEKMFGKGAYAKLPAAEKKARVDQLKKFGVNHQNYGSFGDALQSWVADVQAAAAILAKPSAPPVEKAKPKGKLTPEEFDDGALAPPIATDPELTKREKTLMQKTQDYYREHGITGRDQPREQLNGVPD